MAKIIHVTDQVPAPVGPYSQAVEINGFVYCSGQIPLDAASGELILGDIQQQTEKVMKNIEAMLASMNMTFQHVIKTMIFVKNMEDFAAVNEIYASYFKENPPARSCVEAAALPKGVGVEIEVIAHRDA